MSFINIISNTKKYTKDELAAISLMKSEIKEAAGNIRRTFEIEKRKRPLDREQIEFLERRLP